MGQHSQERLKVVTVPRDIILATVAYQPDCPLQFENASLLAAVNGGGAPDFDLRNRGTKPIRALAVGDSTGNKLIWDAARYLGPVLPGELVPQGGSQWIQIVPLTDELREKLKLKGPMQGMLVLMVIRVEFTDGTIYDDEKAYKAMLAYVEDLESKRLLLESLKTKCK